MTGMGKAERRRALNIVGGVAVSFRWCYLYLRANGWPWEVTYARRGDWQQVSD